MGMSIAWHIGWGAFHMRELIGCPRLPLMKREWLESCVNIWTIGGDVELNRNIIKELNKPIRVTLAISDPWETGGQPN